MSVWAQTESIGKHLKFSKLNSWHLVVSLQRKAKGWAKTQIFPSLQSKLEAATESEGWLLLVVVNLCVTNIQNLTLHQYDVNIVVSFPPFSAQNKTLSDDTSPPPQYFVTLFCNTG